MKVTYRNSLEYKIQQHIEKSSNNVFIRKDFAGWGSYRQISRVLNKLISQRKLVRIGFGIYAKAYISQYVDTPLLVNGFDVAAREALDRIGIEWKPSHAEKEYNSGQTQQVPTQNIVRLKGRLRRNIQYYGRHLYFEGNINAR